MAHPLKHLSIVLLGFALLACGGPAPVAQTPRPDGPVITAKAIFDEMVRGMTAERAKRPWSKDDRLDRTNRALNPYDMLEIPIEDWLGTEEGRFAHAIKIPNPVPADSGYKPGMTQQEYFELLCRNEAGEFIFKTAENVEGIHQIRPRRLYSHGEWRHLYALEDPYGYWVGEWDEVGTQITGKDLYSYFEIQPSGRRRYDLVHKVSNVRDESLFLDPPVGATIARHFGYDSHTLKTMKLEYDTKSRARYGFTWRGVKRPMDREMGIAGGELIVLDLQTNEVMGVRRGYNIWNRGWTGRMCPRYGYIGGQDKTTNFTAWFVAKVARPTGWKDFFAMMEKGRRMVGTPSDKRY